MKQKYVTLEYLTQNNPNPDGIQFKGIFGNRSIGKTHAVIKMLQKNRKPGTAFMILRRKQNELNLQPFVNKFSAALDVDWTLDKSGMIIENGETIVAYFSALSLAERGKHMNFDVPYVTDIVVDEVYAQNPNKHEYEELKTWISTLSRRTGHPFHPITVWLLGNYDYGYSPILDNLEIFPRNGSKQKTANGVYLFSQMESPENVINVRHPQIKKMEIFKNNEPLLDWHHMGQSYALYDMGQQMYIANIERSTHPFDMKIQGKIVSKSILKYGIPRVLVENYDCLRFIDHPALKYTI